MGPGQNVRDILMEYARAYFGPAVAEDAADAILALERNWRGPLIDNGAVEGTLLEWQDLERRPRSCEATGAGRCACCAPTTTRTSGDG